MGQSPGKARTSARRATGKAPLYHTQKRFNRVVVIKISIYTLFWPTGPEAEASVLNYQPKVSTCALNMLFSSLGIKVHETKIPK